MYILNICCSALSAEEGGGGVCANAIVSETSC